MASTAKCQHDQVLPSSFSPSGTQKKQKKTAENVGTRTSAALTTTIKPSTNAPEDAGSEDDDLKGLGMLSILYFM